MTLRAVQSPAGQLQLQLTELQLIEQRVANEKKSVALAYVLWFFLGGFGIHNFYLGKAKLALFQMLGGIVAIVFLLIGLGHRNGGALFAVAVVIWIVWAVSFIVDLFMIPGRANSYSARLRERYGAELIAQRNIAAP